MKQILLKIALFFSLIMIPVLVLFLTPYSKEFAYHYIKNDCYNHGAWLFDRITKNKVPIDVAFIGSSHTIHAFQEKKMEDSLGQNYHLANFGYCRYGRNLQYTILKLLLQHKSPKLIALEVSEGEEKNSHDIFPYLAETSDLLFTPTLINRDYFSDLYYGASARLECFKATYIFDEKFPEPDNGLYGYGEAQRTATKEEMIDNEKAWKKRLERKTSKSVEDVQLRYPLAYLKKMVELINKTRHQRFRTLIVPYACSLFGGSFKRANTKWNVFILKRLNGFRVNNSCAVIRQLNRIMITNLLQLYGLICISRICT